MGDGRKGGFIRKDIGGRGTNEGSEGRCVWRD